MVKRRLAPFSTTVHDVVTAVLKGVVDAAAVVGAAAGAASAFFFSGSTILAL